MSKNYFEIVYNGPFKGIHTNLPEDVIPKEYSPFMENVILKNGEIRSRPRQNNIMPGPPDKKPILTLLSFIDQNNVVHTCAVTSSGLWQLNARWAVSGKPTAAKTWQQIGSFLDQPGPNNPTSTQVFIDKFFWTNGGNHLWMWDGISSIGAPRIWGKVLNFRQGDILVDSNGNIQVANTSGLTGTIVPTWGATLGAQTVDGTITWTENGKYIRSNGFIDAAVVDATKGYTAGGYFLIELNAQLLLCNTVESTGNFPQRVRWCPSGLPTIWDPNVNIGAGFNDELDVPDVISGAFTVGTTAFILRTNGITEVTSNGSGINPFNFNHLWASKRGIGNILPFGFAAFGPLGVFISSDDIYSVSMGGFNRIGKDAKDGIYRDLYRGTNIAIGSIVPYYDQRYVYNHYRLSIPINNDTITWIYCFEDESWQREVKRNINHTSNTIWAYIN
jgi:hypothetical protein